MEKKRQKKNKRDVENLTNTTSGNKISQDSKLSKKLKNKLKSNELMESIDKQDVDTMFKNLVPNEISRSSKSKEYVKDRLREALFTDPQAKVIRKVVTDEEQQVVNTVLMKELSNIADEYIEDRKIDIPDQEEVYNINTIELENVLRSRLNKQRSNMTKEEIKECKKKLREISTAKACAKLKAEK